MRPGEVVVARLSGGVAVVRFTEDVGSRVKLALGRNREARVPAGRVLLATGLVPGSQEAFEEFRARCQAVASEIDLSEVWDVVVDDAETSTLHELAELYWDDGHDAARLAALALHLEEGTDYFAADAGGYAPRSRDDLESLLTRRNREAKHAAEAQELASALADGHLPEAAAEYQDQLLLHLQGFAVHGDDYGRGSLAKNLLHQVDDRARDLQRLAFNVLVEVGVFSPDEPLELHRAEVDGDYPDAALEEVKQADVAAVLSSSSRTDLTGLAGFTIDDEGTEDRDDALSVEPLDAGLRVGIHIADAGALIVPGGAIDIEAGRRMATLYVPERKIEMLPPGFAQSSGSLDPGYERPAMSLLVDLDEEGEVTSWEVVPSVVRTQAAFSYEEADEALVDSASTWSEPLGWLVEVASSRRKVREEAGAVTIDRPEMSIKVDADGEISVRVVERAAPARETVAELMILCNSILAEYCRDHGIPAAYRSQAAPDVSALGSPPADDADPAQLALHRSLLGRLMRPASISTVPEPHGGLGVAVYIQATSPLRRYPDLVMQRQIGHYLEHGDPLYSAEEIASVAHRADAQLRELARVEEQRKRYWLMKYLQQQRLEQEPVFEAYVLENPPRRPAMLELAELPFRVRTDLPEGLEPGATIQLRLQAIDLWKRHATFEYLTRPPALS